MKTCIMNVENLATMPKTTEENVVNNLNKKDKLYLCYKENTNVPITNFFSLSNLYERTNVEFVKQNDELLVLFGVVFANAKENDNLYVDKGIIIPSFILDNTKIGIDYLDFGNNNVVRQKRKYTKRKNKENKVEQKTSNTRKNTKNSKDKTNVNDDKKKENSNSQIEKEKTKEIDNKKEIKKTAADSVNYPVKKKRGRPSKKSQQEKQTKANNIENEQLTMNL